MRKILILLVTFALVGCNSTPVEETKAPDPQADRDAINKLRDDFIAAFNANDAAKIGELYSETAVSLPRGMPTLQGRAAIVEQNKGFFDQNMAKITVTSRAMNVSGDLAFDEGTFTVEVTPKVPAGAKPITEEGRYLIVLQRGMDGAWKVIEDIDNVSSMPVTTPTAATGTKAKD